MSTNLVHKDSTWIVSFNDNKEIKHEKFDTIELAANFMIHDLNVKDEHIDAALIEMYSLNKGRSIFNSEGEFIGSDV